MSSFTILEDKTNFSPLLEKKEKENQDRVFNISVVCGSTHTKQKQSKNNVFSFSAYELRPNYFLKNMSKNCSNIQNYVFNVG